VDSDSKLRVFSTATSGSTWSRSTGVEPAPLTDSYVNSPTQPIQAVSPVRKTKRLAKPPRLNRIVAVGGGKGGVGKSLVTSSLGISLAKRGKRVVVVDADLGGANLHTCLGLTSPTRTLSDFIARRVSSIEDVLLETGVPNLRLISGAHDHLTASNLKYFQKKRLLSKISEIDADYILLDIGAGITLNIIDFFLLADEGLLVVVPEPSSIENAYRFVKTSLYRLLWRALKTGPARGVVEHAMDQKNAEGIRTPFDLLEAIERVDAPTGQMLKEKARGFRPRLLINQLRFPEDEGLGRSMATVCRRHLGIDIDAIGSVSFDESVWKANRKRRPFMLDYPESTAGAALGDVADSLIFSHRGSYPRPASGV